MRSCKQQVIAEIFKVRHAAFFARRIGHGNGAVNGTNSVPKEAYSQFGIKIEATRRTDRLHDGQRRPNGIEAKPEKRIPNAAAESLEIRKPIPHFATPDTLWWSIGPKDRNTQDHSLGMRGRKPHKLRDAGCRMLAIRIHDKDMGKSRRLGSTKAEKDCSALARILRQLHEAKTRMNG